jgi:hypothetical protein
MKHNISASLFVLVTGLALSGVAALLQQHWINSNLCCSAFWPVVIMGSILEIGKLAADVLAIPQLGVYQMEGEDIFSISNSRSYGHYF